MMASTARTELMASITVRTVTTAVPITVRTVPIAAQTAARITVQTVPITAPIIVRTELRGP